MSYPEVVSIANSGDVFAEQITHHNAKTYFVVRSAYVGQRKDHHITVYNRDDAMTVFLAMAGITLNPSLEYDELRGVRFNSSNKIVVKTEDNEIPSMPKIPDPKPLQKETNTQYECPICNDIRINATYNGVIYDTIRCLSCAKFDFVSFMIPFIENPRSGVKEMNKDNGY